MLTTNPVGTSDGGGRNGGTFYPVSQPNYGPKCQMNSYDSLGMAKITERQNGAAGATKGTCVVTVSSTNPWGSKKF